MAVSLGSARVRAQVENDDIGWGPPSAPQPSAEPAPSNDDALGWSATEPSAEPAPPHDDALGWSAPAPSGAPPPATEDVATESPLRVTGRYQNRLGLHVESLDDTPLAQARTQLQLELDFRVAGELGELSLRSLALGEYDAAYAQADPALREVYEWQVLLREARLEFTTGPLTLGVGRQIVTLGHAELLTQMDVVNPRDLREPGLADPDSVRLGVLLSRASLLLGTHRLEAIVIHEAEFDLLAPPLGQFSPIRKLLTEDPLVGPQLSARRWRLRHVPEGFRVEKWQGLGVYNVTSGALDLQFMGGSILDRVGVPRMPSPADLEQPELDLEIHHPRYLAFAHGGSLAVGDVLLRWEVGVDVERPQTLRIGISPPRFAMGRYTQLNGMLGVTYFGLADVNVSLELAKSHLPANPERETDSDSGNLLWPVESPSLAARWTQSFFQQKVQLTVFGVVFGMAPFGGALVHGALSYSAADGLLVSIGYVHYAAPSRFGTLYGFEDNDRAYANLRWDFMVL